MGRTAEKNHKKYYLIYTGVFLIMTLGVFCHFLFSRRSFIWEPDGYQQHYTALVYIGRWLRKLFRSVFLEHRLVLPMWDLNIGYGADILTTLEFYGFGNPFSLLSAIVPSAYTEYLYNGLSILYLYLSGLAFSSYCFSKNRKETAVMAGAFSYIFCGYALCVSVRHPFFLFLLLFFPMLLKGADRITEGKSPVLFIIFVFLSAVSNFYLFYMLTAGIVIYVLVSFFSKQEPKRFKEFLSLIGRFVLFGLIGVLMAAVLLLPVFLVLMGSARAEAALTNYPFYNLTYYEKLFTVLMNYRTAGSWTYLGFTAPAVLAVVCLFSKKGNRKTKIWLFVLTLMLFIPFAGKLMNGFSYVTNRWCGMYAFLVSYILVEQWDCLIRPQIRQAAAAAGTAAVYTVLLLLFRSEANINTFVSFGYLMAGIIFMVISCVSVQLSDKNTSLPEKTEKRLTMGMFSLVICGILTTAGFGYSSYFQDYVSEHTVSGKALANALSLEAGAVKSIAGAKSREGRYEGGGAARNDNTLVEVPGISFYWSLSNGNISQFQKEMLFHASTFKTSIDYFGNGRRTFLDALSAVHYYVNKDEDTAYMPYGFKKAGTVSSEFGDFTVFENEYPLPFAFTYPQYISRDAYDHMSALERQEALLQGVLIEKEDEEKIQSYEEIDPVLTNRELSFSVETGDLVTDRGDGTFTALKSGAQITFVCDSCPNSETYLYLQGMDFRRMTELDWYLDEDEDYRPRERLTAMTLVENLRLLRQHIRADRWSDGYVRAGIRINTPYSSTILEDKSEHYQWYEGEEDYLINLGYARDGCSSITLTLPYAGEYHFDGVKVFCQPMDHYPDYIRRLKEDPVSVKFDTNRINADVELKDDRILCFSIPYEKGWTACVDGEEVPILRADTMYMALPLTAGRHEIVLNYETWGLKKGLFISFFGLLGLIAAGLVFRRKKVPGTE